MKEKREEKEGQNNERKKYGKLRGRELKRYNDRGHRKIIERSRRVEKERNTASELRLYCCFFFFYSFFHFLFSLLAVPRLAFVRHR